MDVREGACEIAQNGETGGPGPTWSEIRRTWKVVSESEKAFQDKTKILESR